MDLIESLENENTVRGIALNKQIIDLFNIIEESSNRQEAINRVNQYLEEILEANKIIEEAKSQRLNTAQRIKKVVDEKAHTVSDKEKFYNFLLENETQISLHWDSKEKLEKLFVDKEIESTYINEILNIKKYFTYQPHGILTFLVDEKGQTIDTKNTDINIDKNKTYQKAEALHEYIVGNLPNKAKRFNRVTFDGQGRFGTIAGLIKTSDEASAKLEDYNLEQLKQGYEFAKKHGMDVRLHTIVFFKDFPERLIGENKEAYKTALIKYGKAIATVVNEYKQQGVPTVVDMFNEFVDHDEPFSIRTNNWMSKLSIEDLCEIALILKQEMPEVEFGYNDWNFENKDKRKSIFEVIRRIQAFEKEKNRKILDFIGTQCHISVSDKEGLQQSIEELQQFNLPIDITELDISKELYGVNYSKTKPEELNAIVKVEQKLQNEIMKMISDFVKNGKVRGVTAWSITDELCADFCKEKHASIIDMNYDEENGFTFLGKDMDKEIKVTQQEINIIQEHKKGIRTNEEQEINLHPIQDFCFHTHTQRCGHGAKDTGDEEWVKNAIKGGIKKLAFTDHIPLPDGMNHEANSRMDIAEVESYLTSINYLKEKYKEKIDIESGFEFEYSTKDLDHIQKLKLKTDKMILGQHFVIDNNGRKHEIKRRDDGKPISDEVLDLYAKSVIDAMHKKLPNIIAHPDLFMQCRNDFGELEENITREICRAAIETNTPLEINFGKIAPKVESKNSIDELKEKISYPSADFWRIVAEETQIAKQNGKDLIVIYGKDAHYPDQLVKQRDYEIANEIIGQDTIKQLHIVKNYQELENILRTSLKDNSQQNGKNGFEDCMDDDRIIVTSVTNATRNTKNNIIEIMRGNNEKNNNPSLE